MYVLREEPPNRAERKTNSMQGMGTNMHQLRQTQPLQTSMQTTETKQPDAAYNQQQHYNRTTTSQRYRGRSRLLGPKRARRIPSRLTTNRHTPHAALRK